MNEMTEIKQLKKIRKWFWAWEHEKELKVYYIIVKNFKVRAKG